MRIGVLGASSIIGQAVVDRLRSMGHDVQIWGRQQSGGEDLHLLFDLDAPTPLTGPTCESAVLLSWIGDPRTPEVMQRNKSSYQFLADELQRSSTFPVFVSTATSSQTSRSVHARAKFATEQLFDGWGAIVRPGRILFRDGRIAGRAARKSWLMSQIGSVIRTDLKIPTVQIDAVAAKIVTLAISRTPGTWDLQDELVLVGSHRKFAPLVPRRIIHYFVLGVAFVIFRQKSNILDRWYALIDAQRLEQDN
jgi:hypothetical protein